MLAIFIQPLIVLGLFLSAALVGRFILHRLRPGRLRSILSYRMPIHPQTEEERRDWAPVLIVLGIWLMLMAVLLYLDPLRH